MNLGILGISDICQKAVMPYISREIDVVAAASRSYEKANLFSKKYNISKVFGNYNELLEDKAIDSVYVALPPTEHFFWVCESLLHNKNVLVEKPMCLFEKEFVNIYRLLGNKVLMEAIMIQHHPWMLKVKEILKSKKYGKTLRCFTTITMNISDEMKKGFRTKLDLGGGVLIDELPYWFCIMQNVFDNELNLVDGIILEKKYGVAWKAKIFGKVDNVDVSFYCSYNDLYSSDLLVEMENATLKVNNFFRASLGQYKIVIQVYDNKKLIEKIFFEKQNYYYNQLKCFSNCIKNKNYEKKHIKNSKERVFYMEKVLYLVGER